MLATTHGHIQIIDRAPEAKKELRHYETVRLRAADPVREAEDRNPGAQRGRGKRISTRRPPPESFAAAMVPS